MRRLVGDVTGLARVLGGNVAALYTVRVIANLPRIIRDKTLETADSSMRARSEYKVRYRSADLQVPGRCFPTIREMFARDVYMWPFALQIRPGITVIDLGCNEGFFSLFAAKRGAKVVAVDAQAGFRNFVMDNGRRNGCEECMDFEFALVGAGSGLFAEEHKRQSGSHFGGEPSSITMDELFARHSIAMVEFMKVDIEGAEFGLFSGSLDWLDRVSTIAMEVHATFGEPSKLVELLSTRGFQTIFANGDLIVQSSANPQDGYIYATRGSLLLAPSRGELPDGV